jgi:NAD(P)-dependent dehydrogenase (short-subunit alcohol dehydrogenase family)
VARFCEGQVVVISGAGRGIGRAHALAFAEQGAKVVVNDLGTTYAGAGQSSEPADEVVAEINAAGGEAVANGDDVADPDGARRIIATAIDTFGDLTTVVSNAGIIRGASLADMTTEDMNASWGVHVLGAFHLAKYAAEFWRPRIDAGEKLNASVINTSSAAGLWPSPMPGAPEDDSSLAAYGTVKAAVAALTITLSADLFPYGIRVNAIAPGGRTRMNTTALEDVGRQGMPEHTGEGFDLFDPSNVSPLVVWLSSPEAADISGRVFESGGGRVAVANGWTHGPSAFRDDRRWDPAELGATMRKLLAEAPAPQTMAG